MTTGDLFDGTALQQTDTEPLAEGAVLLRGFAAPQARALAAAIEGVAHTAPFRHMITPGGHRMSAAMTNCGAAGWVSDRRGYRYEARDPESRHSWPAMPVTFLELAERAAAVAGFAGFVPNACLINRYGPKARMGLHQDKDEVDFSQPIVSVSLGLPATFLFGGARRNNRPRRLTLQNGDVVVWGGPARMYFHGVAPLADGSHPLTGACRLNLTFRSVARCAISP